MSKGSVRQRGGKWYYRFYVEDESGNRVQKEFNGGRTKRETETMLRRALSDYETRQYLIRRENTTVGELLDMWVEEDLTPGNKSNGTVTAYLSIINRIKQHPISNRKLKNVTTKSLQDYLDFLCFGGVEPGGLVSPPLAMGSVRLYMAILQGAFRYAVYPKKLLAYNPMQYVVRKERPEEAQLFETELEEESQILTHEQFLRLCDFLEGNSALLPVQISYYTGLRVGEVCALTWQDINMKEQFIIVRRSIRYNTLTHQTEMGTTKRNKIRTVDFCDTLADILREAKRRQASWSLQYGPAYFYNYYQVVMEKGRRHFEIHSVPRSEATPDDYHKIDMVCLREDGTFTTPGQVSQRCRKASQKLEGMEKFHFHKLRHTFTSNLLHCGATPKDVQELLGHSDISTTMNIYAHSSREDKRTSARRLDQMLK